jgi:ABC-type Fe3+-hydroxamate transport system substrate-binding protein
LPFIDSNINTLKRDPRRIISLVPSITELLFDLGLDQEVIGITKFCVHPQHWITTKTNIGGTKNLNFEKINALKPDLIIANKEEQVKEQIEILAHDYPIYLTDINTYDAALEMIANLGELTNRKTAAENIINQIDLAFENLKDQNFSKSCIYLIWNNPIMASGQQTYINAILEKIGFQNCINTERYPELQVEQIQQLNPEYILLSSEPYPFKEKHVHEFKLLFPNAKIGLVDGELFSWYGSRMRLLPEYLVDLLYSHFK